MYRISKKKYGHFCRGGQCGRYAPPTGHNAHAYFATFENDVWSQFDVRIGGVIAVGQHLLVVLI